MRLGDDAHDVGRRDDKANLPARQREYLAGGADLDRSFAHGGNRQHRDMRATVENDMLPDFVADGDGVETRAIARQQFDLRALVNDAAGIQWIVEDHRARAFIEHGVEIGFGERPARRSQRHETRDAARALHKRQIGVVCRLEQNDFVAGLNGGENRAGDGLGGARGHHRFRRRVDFHAMEPPVMFGDRAAQLRQAHHRRILIVAVQDGVGGLAAHVLGTGIVGKALPQIDGLLFAGERRHHLEDGGGQIGEKTVHPAIPKHGEPD